VARNIRPALKEGRTVILDRYYYSTLAYQGARGLPLQEIRRRHRRFAIVPDLVLILDVPVSTGLRRIKDRPIIYGHFEEKEYLKKVRKIFCLSRTRSAWWLTAGPERRPFTGKSGRFS